MPKYTPFGSAVKTNLLSKCPAQSLTWLREEIYKTSGLKVDSSYMGKILTGKRKAPKVVAVIEEILCLTENLYNCKI